MEAATVPHQIQKRQYKNNTGGYLGVVVLDHNGQEQGVNIDPYGTIWLSDAEAILTSRAPRRPEDNPFEEQPLIFVNPETGAREERKVRPLTLVGDGQRFVPANDRYVPPGVDPFEGKAIAEGAAKADVPETVSTGNGAVQAVTERVEAEGATRPVAAASATVAVPEAAPQTTGSQEAPAPAPAPPAAPPVPVPPMRQEPRPTPPPEPSASLAGAPGAPAEAETEQAASWVGEPEAPGQVLTGSLGGSDAPPPEVTASAAPDPTLPQPGDQVAAPPATEPQVPGATPVAEEHAAVDRAVGEETGAATPPVAPAAEGEYARAEEVGSPEAPAASDGDGGTSVGE